MMDELLLALKKNGEIGDRYFENALISVMSQEQTDLQSTRGRRGVLFTGKIL
jgi:hypothetical protein